MPLLQVAWLCCAMWLLLMLDPEPEFFTGVEKSIFYALLVTLGPVLVLAVVASKGVLAFKRWWR